MGEVTVDFVARDQPHGGWSLVLVERGPWNGDDVSEQLRRVQERLYNCLDAALDGAVVTKYPDARNKPLLIRMDAYDVPERELRDFFSNFSEGVARLPDYARALSAKEFFPSISFKLNVEQVSP